MNAMSPAELRPQVYALIEEHVANENLRRHMLACEAIMRALAQRFGEDPDAWGLAGLGHDLDVELTLDDSSKQGVIAAEKVTALGGSPEVAHAMAAHNDLTGVAAESRLDVALIAADQLSGLITAAALIRPDKSLAQVQLKSLRKRYKETAFARGADRESIARCQELGLDLDEFMAIGLEAMQGIAAELGLE
jgi:predicted hydrolase (HD superfamily)